MALLTKNDDGSSSEEHIKIELKLNKLTNLGIDPQRDACVSAETFKIPYNLEKGLLLPASAPEWFSFVDYAIGDLCVSAPTYSPIFKVKLDSSPSKRIPIDWAARSKAFSSSQNGKSTVAMTNVDGDSDEELHSDMNSSVLAAELQQEQDEADEIFNNETEVEHEKYAEEKSATVALCKRQIFQMVATLLSGACYVGVWRDSSPEFRFPPARGDLKGLLFAFINRRFDLSVLAKAIKSSNVNFNISNHILCKSTCEKAIRYLTYPLSKGSILTEFEISRVLVGNVVDCWHISNFIRKRINLASSVALNLENICSSIPKDNNCLTI